jgi:hypothetical protein
VLVSINELAYNARCTGRGIDRVETGCIRIVINARQVECPGGVIEVESHGAISVETERSDRRDLGSVFIDCE